MKTMTTVEAVERTPSGAYKVTFPPSVIAGTLDAEIGALAERLASEENANPVEVHIEEIAGGKLEIVSLTEITEPDTEPVEQPADEPPTVVASGALDEPTLDAVLTEGLAAYSGAALLAELGERLARLEGLDK